MRKKSTIQDAHKLFDMDKVEVDPEVKELLYDEATQQIAYPEDEAILVQLPGTLPFSEIKPHATNALEDMIEMLSADAKVSRHIGHLSSDGENIEEDNLNTDVHPPKIGKLRVMKSGKIVMRIQLPGQEDYVDLELNQGIKTNFYQEIISVDAQNKKLHFLSSVKNKLVATPDLDSMLSWTNVKSVNELWLKRGK